MTGNVETLFRANLHVDAVKWSPTVHGNVLRVRASTYCGAYFERPSKSTAVRGVSFITAASVASEEVIISLV